MHFTSYLLVASAAVTGIIALPVFPERLPTGFRQRPRFTPNQARADAVQEAFVHAWTGYKKYAFPNDELHPVSNGFGNSRSAQSFTVSFRGS